MTLNSVLCALAGGALIGGASGLLWLTNGRVAGISGVVGGLLPPLEKPLGWRVSFLLGLIGTGAIAFRLFPEAFEVPEAPDLQVLAVAGLLVGFGSQLGGGCTSGHGVCGVGRASPRSLVATATFMLTAVITVLVVRLCTGAS
jgi:uncharacterized protein